MSGMIIIEGNSVYELDENCMLKKAHDSPDCKKEKPDRKPGKEKEPED